MPKQKTNRQIPRTRLREIYKLLETCSSSHFHLDFAKELARKNNPDKFASYLDEDVKRFHAYDNKKDLFLDYSKRKSLPRTKGIQEITTTNHIAALFEKQKTMQIALSTNSEPASIEYVGREIRPCRTTENATYVDGLPAAAQRQLDLLLVGKGKQPSLGEVKVRGDKNPFYALIQLLMYASELLSEYQRARLLNSFPGVFAENYKSLDLYIVLHKYNCRGKVKEEILEQTRLLSKKLIKFSRFNKHIRSIHCIDVKLKGSQAGPYLKAEQMFAHARD